jgi:glutathione S-transferase
MHKPEVAGSCAARWPDFAPALTDWLDGAFSAGDLLMVSVLIRLKRGGLLQAHPDLAAYVARGEARSAYKRAFEAQQAVFNARSTG